MVDRNFKQANVTATSSQVTKTLQQWVDLASLDAMETWGAVGNGSTNDATAVSTMLQNAGVRRSGRGRAYKLTSGITRRGVDIDLSDAHFIADTPVTIAVGGSVDTGTTITPSVATLATGVREIPYTTLTGPLAAGDWIFVMGRLDGAFTLDSGRNVQNGVLVQVRAVDTTNKIIRLYQPIPHLIDSATIEGTAFPLTVEKVNPVRVNIKNVTLKNVALHVQYVIDSDIDIVLKEADGVGFTHTLQYAHNCDLRVRARSRNTSSVNHNIIVQHLYACRIDFASSGTNYVDGAGKALRANGLNFCHVKAQFLSVGYGEFVVQVCVECTFDMMAADDGTFGKDTLDTTANRNDAIAINFARRCSGRFHVVEPEACGVEFYNCFDCDFTPIVMKARSSPAGNTELINIKGGSRNTTVRPTVRNSGDPTSPAFKVEFLDQVDGIYVTGIRIVDPDIEAVGTGIIFRDVPAALPEISAKCVVSGGSIRASNPLEIRRYINDNTITGVELMPLTTGTHACQIASTGNLIKDLVCKNTSGTTRRAVTIALPGNRVENCYSDSGVFWYGENPITEFNLGDWRNLNQPIAFAAKTLRFWPAKNGVGWETDVAEVLDATLNEQVLRNDAVAAGLDFGTWDPGDVLWKADALRGETGYRWNGSKFLREGFRKILAQITNDLASIAAGGTTSFTVTATGAATRDRVSWAFSAGGLTGLQITACVSATDTITVSIYNPTGSAINPASGTWYFTVEKAN